LRRFVVLGNGIQSHNTVTRVFTALDSKQLQANFPRWMSILRPLLEGKILAICGGTTHGLDDRRSGKQTIHIVSVIICGHAPQSFLLIA